MIQHLDAFIDTVDDPCEQSAINSLTESVTGKTSLSIKVVIKRDREFNVGI